MSYSSLNQNKPAVDLDRDPETVDKQQQPLGLSRRQEIVALVCAAGALFTISIHLHGDSQFIVYAYFAIVGALLAVIDVAAIRLPDWLTLPSYPTILILESLNSVWSDDSAALIHAVEATVVVLIVSLMLCICTSMGMGDLKYAGVVALVLGMRGWAAVCEGFLFAWGLASVWGICLICRGRLRSRMPLGPFMTAGALLTLLRL